jgi:hypothetical protein
VNDSPGLVPGVFSFPSKAKEPDMARSDGDESAKPTINSLCAQAAAQIMTSGVTVKGAAATVLEHAWVDLDNTSRFALAVVGLAQFIKDEFKKHAKD